MTSDLAEPPQRRFASRGSPEWTIRLHRPSAATIWTSVHQAARRMPMPFPASRDEPSCIGLPLTGTGRKESGVMFHPNQLRTEPIVTIESGRTGACLVAGCTCKDARIVSFRRAAFFAALARQTGQTADRVIAVEDEWRIAGIEGVELS